MRLPAARRAMIGGLTLALMLACAPVQASAIGPFERAVAASAGQDEAVAAWFRDRGYVSFWTGPQDAERRSALLNALARAADHGLPVHRYDVAALQAGFLAAETEGDRGRLEVAMTRALLDYARDLQTGVLVPKTIDATIVREVPLRDPQANLAAFAADPAAFLKALAPTAPEYAQLMKERLSLQALAQAGGWGAPVPSGGAKPGASGATVVALRDRLVAMGYLARTASQTYDATMQAAVVQFQLDHGLNADGIAAGTTVAELNIDPQERMRSILVAMERLRWMPAELGARHIWVNQPDFTAQIIDHGKVVFQTRAVIGKDTPETHSPEFSDVMEHMVINPSWSVPRSITTKEYLPLLQRNRNAVSYLELVDSNGRVVPRGKVNFGAYNARNFPFALRQPPSDGNALGLVKFMFPNVYNIYLHDTPTKSLFANEVRAYSHGCIRLADPFDFAYALLERQSDDPEGEFTSHLNTKAESVIKLVEPLPVHLVYFTAWPTAKGRMTYRRDVYGRDAAIFQALMAAGVAPDGVQG